MTISVWWLLPVAALGLAAGFWGGVAAYQYWLRDEARKRPPVENGPWRPPYIKP
jgi:hypothetical protein